MIVGFIVAVVLILLIAAAAVAARRNQGNAGTPVHLPRSPCSGSYVLRQLVVSERVSGQANLIRIIT